VGIGEWGRCRASAGLGKDGRVPAWKPTWGCEGGKRTLGIHGEVETLSGSHGAERGEHVGAVEGGDGRCERLRGRWGGCEGAG
jgi:hypothetical protein